MHHIYQSASCLVVWLGPEAEDSNIAMAAIERMGGSFDSVTMKLQDACNVPDVDISDTAWQALARLFRRSWYKRIWILQEVSASENVIVVCGPQSVPWTTFCFAAAYIHYRAGREPSPLPLKDSGYEAPFTLCTFLYDRTISEDSRQRDTGLLRLLTQFRHCKATNPRDKVYAFLGMASDMTDDADFKPNYAKPVAEVYQDLVEFIVTKDRNLDILRACETSGTSGNSVAITHIPEESSTLVAQGVYVDIVIEVSDSSMSTSDAAPRNSLVGRLADNIINNVLDAIDSHGPAIRAAMGISSDGPPVPVSSARYLSDFSSNPRPISSFWTEAQVLGTTQASPM
ncbi:MAG: hypothetical protein Q9176_007558 [Flavoplaca citrina]